MKYYLDTCIWRDYLEDRNDNLKPIGEWAFQLLKKIDEQGDMIIFSDLNRKELLNDYSEKEIEKMLEIISNKNLLLAKMDKGDFKSARKISIEFKIHWSDAMHTKLAINNEAILVTRDKHFQNVRFLVEVKNPEELLLRE